MSGIPSLPFAKVRRIGNTVYLAGEIGFNEDGTVPAGIEAQTRKCIERIQATLESEGLTLKNAISLSCILTDVADFAEFNRVYAEYFNGDVLPVRTTYRSDLMIDAKLEITVIAEA